MSELVTYRPEGPVAKLTMDDGKVNAMSAAMLGALHDAFDRAEQERAVVVLTGRSNIFSAGFDLKVFAEGNPSKVYDMMKLGAELALRILMFPTPVVTACNGHALPMGAFLMMAADARLGADGPFRIGLNEVAIRLTLPAFAIEIARQRLTPAYFNRIVTGETLAPAEAVVAGYLDRIVPPEELQTQAHAIATALSAIDFAAHAATKKLVRGTAANAIRAAIDAEIVLERYEKMAAARG